MLCCQLIQRTDHIDHWVSTLTPQNFYLSAKQNAKRLHGGGPVSGDVQSRFASGIQYMTNKNKNAAANSAKQKAKQQKQKKYKAIGDGIGGVIGTGIGAMYGQPTVGWAAGKWLGSGIGSIVGSGNYHMVGARPRYNVLANGNQIPKFDTTRQTNVICHREYIGDISPSTLFNVSTFPLNPGVSTTFPWLSSVADNYQQYKFHGLVFEFRPLITDFVTNGSPGVIVMATNYNSDAPAYTTKQAMENSEYAVSVKPTLDLMHMVECDPKQTVLDIKYVRTTAAPAGQDLRLYDLGLFQLATQGNPNPPAQLGELWVSYCVEFFKPTLLSNGVSALPGYHANRSGASALNPFGTTAVTSSGTLAAVLTSSTITFPTSSLTNYKVTWYLSNATAITSPSFVLTSGGTAFNIFNNNTDSAFNCNAGGGTYSLVYSRTFTANSSSAVITGATATMTGTARSDIFIETLDAISV